jgi:tetratricopeptide (TPR) repeat protein
MALRLTGTSLPSPTVSPAAVAEQAGVRLASGDVDGYAALFAQTGAQEDHAARYRARLRLIESGLQAAIQATPAGSARIYFVLARALVAILDEEPREPLLLNYAGIAFYELWSLDAARALFGAAARLDPDLAHLQRNLRETNRRRRVTRSGRRHVPAMHAELPGLARRARSIADRALPAEGLTLSLCMIVRNEEEMLPRCLAAAAPLVDEIVVVDTGSTDATIEIARSFGARVIEREWTGSFAEARNASFEAATGDWLIYLDADEVLEPDHPGVLRELTRQVWREAFYLVETSYTGEEDNLTGVVHNSLRVFRNRPAYRFEGQLHEQIADAPYDVPGRIELSSVRVTHYGYLGAIRDARGKSARNIELLRAQESERGSSAFWHFNLGMEYSAVGDPVNAVLELGQAWTLVRQQGLEGRQFVPALVSRLTSALVSAGRSCDAVAMADEALALFPGFTDLVYFKGWALIGLKDEDAAASAWHTCLAMGDAPSRYTAGLGTGTYMALYALAYLHLTRREYDDALALLERCLSEHPSFSAAVEPYMSTLLVQGRSGEAALAELGQRLPAPMSTSARFLVANALQAGGALAAAEQQYRVVLEARPSATHVRVSLAELLIGLGRNVDAVAEARQVDETDPHSAQAARLELWATIAAGELDAVADALTRAATRGVPYTHRQVFEHWAALAAGATPATPLPIAAAPMLGVVLERTLARHDFTTFEALVGILHSSELPERDQRELLASMYLRFGFLQSAAQEWMAVCQLTPDASALLGLARVAAAHGLPEDAITFATQAVALDPASAESKTLLSQLVETAHRAPPAPVS